MKYTVHVISDAEKDLFDIYDYIKKAGYPQTPKNFFQTSKQPAATCHSIRKKVIILQNFKESMCMNTAESL